MTDLLPAPISHPAAHRLLMEGLCQQDLSKVLAASPAVNWFKICTESLENRPAAPGAGCVLAAFAPDFGEVASHYMDDVPAPTRSWPSAEFVRAALGIMVTAGFRLLDDPDFDRDIAHSHMGPLLIEAAVQHNMQDAYQRTVVHLAIGEHLPRPSLVRLALAAGADPNAREERGATPLSYMWNLNRSASYAEDAERAGMFVDVYRALLEHGADESLVDYVGRSMREIMLLALHRDGTHAYGIGKHAALFEEARASAIAAHHLKALDAALPPASRAGSPRM